MEHKDLGVKGKLRAMLFSDTKKRVVLKLFSSWLANKGISHLLKSPKSLKGKIVVITGAASGIGKKLAEKLALNGAKVVIADVDLVNAEKVASEIREKRIQGVNAEALAVHCDLTDAISIQNLSKIVKSHFGRVSILINNAGIVIGKSLPSLSIQEIELTFKVNIISHFLTIKEFLPDMLNSNEGHIVTIASFGGHVGTDKLVDYSASKFACVGLDEALRSELRIMGSNVKTTCINPYFINTGMFEGVNTPIAVLDQDYVVNEIFQAIIWEKKVVFLPKGLEYLLRAARLLPVDYYDFLVNALKFNRSMDSFIGRSKI